MLTPFTSDVWTADIAHPFMGVQMGARMTVVRLPDGSLWVHSPLPRTDALQAEVAALGPVAFVVAPNLMHHLYAGDWARAFPEARLYLAPGLVAKRPDLTPAGTTDQPGPWGDVLEALPLDGQPKMGETTFFHGPSRTLIAADLVHSLPSTDHLWTKVYAWMARLEATHCVDVPVRMLTSDRAAARRSVDAMIARGPERVVVAHGPPVAADGAEVLRRAWSWCG